MESNKKNKSNNNYKKKNLNLTLKLPRYLVYLVRNFSAKNK